MTLLSPLNLHTWIEKHRHLLKPPVGNKCIVDGDFIIMIVGGPNSRTDYHYDEGPEFFYQIEGEIVIKVQDNGVARDIPIRAGELFYLPPRLPHEKDGLLWFCEQCNHKLYEEYFVLQSIETDFPPVFDRFYSSRDARTCKTCGHLNPAPAQYG